MPAFGASSTPAFGSSSSPFGVSASAPAFGSSMAAFGASSTPALGSSSSCFGGSTATASASKPSFRSSMAAFGASSTTAIVSSSFGGTQTSTATFGSSAFGQSTFGGQGRGSRIMAYAATTGTNVDGMYAENFESISAMPKYEDKSHEELRWEDYQVGDRGGPKPAVGQSAGGIDSVTSTSDASGFGERSPALSSSSPFSALSSTNHFMKTSSTTPHTLGAASSPAFGASSSPSLFGAWSPPGFGSFPAIFGCDLALGAAPLLVFGLNFVNTPSVLLSAAPLFWQTNAAFAQNTTPSFGPSNMPSVSTLFQPAAPFSINNSAQTSAGSSVFGQTPAFGLSSPFGICSQTAFGANCPVSGTTHTPAFGTTITSLNGFTPTPTFGSTGTGFAVSSAPAFGFGGALAFSDAGIGTSSTPAFGTSSVPGLVASSTLPCSASSIPTFSFGSTPAFCQSTSPFRSTSQFGTTLPTSGTRISPFGAQATTATFGGTTFGQAALGGQSRGSRVMAYTTTTADGTIENPNSISGMPKYDGRSHEELRWEDYQLGDRGGPNPAADQSAGGINFGVSSGDASGFGAQSPTPSSSSPFSAITSANHFGGAASPAFGASSSPSLFGAWSSPGFGSLPSIFDYASALGAAPPLGFGLNFVNIPSLLSSIAPLFGQTNAASTQNNTFEQNTTPSFGPSNMVFQPAWPFSINNSAQSSAGSSVSSQGACAQRSLNFHPLYIGFLLLFCPLYKY
ncbi:hypothetical protein L1049_010478 [Liquidambar formosana]|uniref:Nuclear pore complex protein NUP98A-like n=1 Tax=Liquidambar formosana TaxID=63359 RepID=A0AAP0NBK1_LIQFO